MYRLSNGLWRVSSACTAGQRIRDDGCCPLAGYRSLLTDCSLTEYVLLVSSISDLCFCLYAVTLFTMEVGVEPVYWRGRCPDVLFANANGKESDNISSPISRFQLFFLQSTLLCRSAHSSESNQDDWSSEHVKHHDPTYAHLRYVTDDPRLWQVSNFVKKTLLPRTTTRSSLSSFFLTIPMSNSGSSTLATAGTSIPLRLLAPTSSLVEARPLSWPTRTSWRTLPKWSASASMSSHDLVQSLDATKGSFVIGLWVFQIYVVDIFLVDRDLLGFLWPVIGVLSPSIRWDILASPSGLLLW